jgi:hypothetical protein
MRPGTATVLVKGTRADSLGRMTHFGHVRRRSFLKGLGVVVPVAAAGQGLALAQSDASTAPKVQGGKPSVKEMAADVVIIGGGVGGCAAALAAARNGLRVIMTEETDWIGGQLTAQAVPPDENQWIETIGGTRSYLDLRQQIRDYYLRHFPLTAAARAKLYLNPGNGWVSRLCHEPRVSVAVLDQRMAPYVGGRRIVILLRHKALDAQSTGDRVEAVRVRSLESGNEIVLRAPYFVDATELGDLLPLTKTEYVTGAESQKDTGEAHAPAQAEPLNMQCFTCCFAMDYLAGQDHTIDRPAEYDFWHEFVPPIKPPWPGRLIAWQFGDPISRNPTKMETDPEKGTGLWTYRRLADKAQFVEGTYPGDISLVNWPQNDYMLGNLCEVSAEEAARHVARAKQLSLSLLYWLQTEAPLPNGGTGWKGLRLRPDVVGTEDGLAKYPYIRESRRIRAEFTVVEQHVSTEARMKETGASKADVKATEFNDSVGIGSYRIDLHPSTGGNNSIDISSLPYQIPLGALLPQRVENLLPACKNLGVTHITNGCYRLHPVEWNIGEAVGALAAFCIARKHIPREVRKQSNLLKEFQDLLSNQGVPLAWPKFGPR